MVRSIRATKTGISAMASRRGRFDLCRNVMVLGALAPLGTVVGAL